MSYKRKNIYNFIVEELARHHLNQVTKVNITSNGPVMGHIGILCQGTGCNEKNTASLLQCPCPRCTLPKFNYEETSDKPQLKDILQNSQPLLWPT